MNWTALAITRNRDALLRAVALWIASVGRFAPGGGPVATLPRYVRGNVLRLLRPAESAARRLIFVLAQQLTVTRRAARPCPKNIPRGKGSGRGPCFRLIDPRKNFAPRPKRRTGPGPRIWVIGYDDSHLPLCARQPRSPERKPPPPSPDDPVSADRLCRRLQSLQRALDDLPKQARRMAHLMARRAQADPGPGRIPPLRPGWPPGYRKRRIHPVDDILMDCHLLSHRAFAQQTRPSFQRAPPSRGSFFA